VKARDYILHEHVHSPCRVYPTLGAGGAWVPGATLVAGAAAGVFGAYADIIPAGVLTEPFDIHWFSVEYISNTAEYEVVIAVGAPGSEVEVGRFRFARLAVQNSENGFPFMMKVHAPNSRVRGKLASSAAGAPSIRLCSHYHYY